VDTSTVARPASISHYDVQPMINVYAAVDGRDLGSVAKEVTKLVDNIQPQLHSRTSPDHELLVFRARRRTGGRYRSGLPPYRRQLPVLARSFHHHHRSSRRP